MNIMQEVYNAHIYGQVSCMTDEYESEQRSCCTGRVPDFFIFGTSKDFKIDQIHTCIKEGYKTTERHCCISFTQSRSSVIFL